MLLWWQRVRTWQFGHSFQRLIIAAPVRWLRVRMMLLNVWLFLFWFVAAGAWEPGVRVCSCSGAGEICREDNIVIVTTVRRGLAVRTWFAENLYLVRRFCYSVGFECGWCWTCESSFRDCARGVQEPGVRVCSLYVTWHRKGRRGMYCCHGK